MALAEYPPEWDNPDLCHKCGAVLDDLSYIDEMGREICPDCAQTALDEGDEKIIAQTAQDLGDMIRDLEGVL